MRTALIVGTLLLAGCAESRITTPSNQGLDLQEAGRANASMNALVSGPGMVGIAALGGRMPAELGAPAAASGLSVAGAWGVSAIAGRLLQAVSASAGPLAVQVIRPSVLGRTYVYDPGSHRYITDPARDGAPSSGVRFILYAVDPGSHEPQVSQETGYADLTDQHAQGLGVSLRFRAVASGHIFLDYSFSLTPTFTGGSLAVTGFLADEQDRLDFTLGASGSSFGEPVAHLTFDLRVASQQFHATGAIDAVPNAGGKARVDVVVSIGSGTVHLLGQSTKTSVNAALSVNGHLLATITGDPHHPTVLGEGGRDLTLSEITALGGLVGMIYGVIEMFEHLLDPVAVLLGISISL